MKTAPLSFLIGLAFIARVHATSADPARLPGPLLEGLGDLHHPVTTQSKLAQRYFNQGMTLAYAFNHSEAIRSFRSAAAVDPTCAMAYWGVALAYGPHVNKPMSPEENQAAFTALQQAIAAKSNATRREQAFINALAARYQAEHMEDRSSLDQAYANAMRALVRQYPDDLDAQTLFAEALMDTMPWDYWRKDQTPKPEAQEAMNALRFVLKRNPNHPGANHLLIHAVEAGPNPELALPAADRLAKFGPTAGHLVHMPSHIYMRVGQYHDAVVANEKAVAADEAYLRQTRAQGFYPGAYYPHNIHFLWWALLYEGRSQEAYRTAERAAQYAVDNYCSPNKAVEAPRFRHLPWLTALRFGRWDTVLKVPQPPMTNDFLVDRALWHFARGLAFAGKHEVDRSSHELSELSKLAGSEQAKELSNPQLPVAGILQVAECWLRGKVSAAKGDSATAIEQLEKAVELEDSLGYMEPSYWPIPVRPALGATLLQMGNATRAEQVFRTDLERSPRNPWGLLGLEQALRAQDRQDSADMVARQFQQSWMRADTDLELAWF